MIRLARYLKYFKKQVVIGPAFKLAEAVFELIVPLVMARIIDVGIRNQDTGYILRMGGLMVALGLMGLCFALICQYSAAKASQGVGTMLRDDLFRHLNQLSHGELDKIGTNSMITRVTNDVNQIQLAVAMLIRLVVRAPFLVVGAIIMSMMLDLKLSLIFLAVAPLVALVLYAVMGRSIPFYRVRQKRLDRISLITRENLSGVRVVRAFAKQQKEEERFEEANQELTDLVVRVGKLSAVLNPATFLIMNTAILLIIYFGGYRVLDGAMTQGEVYAMVNYMTQISLALVVVANLVVIFTKASASAARINEIFDIRPGMKEGELQPGQIRPVPGAPRIEFDHVSFAYPGGEKDSSKDALSDAVFSVRPGETLGIIGGTGSGKTTLVNLIPRFYEATKGQVLVDGIPVQDYSFKALRRQIGIVPQKAVLFYGTIRDNLRWGNEDAPQEVLEWAAKTAQAKDFIRQQNKGYDTLVLQGAKNFSGGQKQRLTIARALAAQPKILILDDSSSALDYATDARLRQALKDECRDMTVVIVSQRTSSIRHADQILVLDDGKIVGKGTHEELLKDCKEYREICESQESSGEEVK